MKIVKQGFEFINPKFKADEGKKFLEIIEMAARNCYQSESGDTEKFVRKIMTNNHLSTIEHCNITIKAWTDRGVSHEIVRHRLASFSQSSTRYCNYSQDKFDNQISLIEPVWFKDVDSTAVDKIRFKEGYVSTIEGCNDIFREEELCYVRWYNACEACEEAYFDLLDMRQTPQEARSVLPNSLKTDIIMTMNLRSWRNFFKLRCAKAAHPQMRDLAINMLAEFHKVIPIVFEDLVNEFFGNKET